jgi:hypothetical protein
LATELGGAGGAGVGRGALGALPFGRVEEDLAAAPPLVELAVAVRPFFFTIVRSGEDRKSSGGGAAVAKGGRRRRTRRCYGKCGRRLGIFSPFGDFKENLRAV